MNLCTATKSERKKKKKKETSLLVTSKANLWYPEVFNDIKLALRFVMFRNKHLF